MYMYYVYAYIDIVIDFIVRIKKFIKNILVYIVHVILYYIIHTAAGCQNLNNRFSISELLT